MDHRRSPRVSTPYLVGPCSRVYGGGADTVLMPTFRLPVERALLYGGQAAFRGATPLVLYLVGTPSRSRLFLGRGFSHPSRRSAIWRS